MMPHRRAVVLFALPASLSAFVSRKPLFVSNAKVKNTAHRRSNGLTMYFDDVSRGHSIEWNPSGGELDGIGGGTMRPLDLSQVESAAAEKVKAMKRLFGHDADSASLLSDDEVRQQMISWAEESGLVGKDWGSTEKYEALLGLLVGKAVGGKSYEVLLGLDIYKSHTLVGCLAGFWKSILSFIQENADEHYPDIWKTDNLEVSRVHMIAFPNCPALYDYDTMSTLSAAVEFCKDTSVHYGKKFSLTLFHPRYENAPKMISPMRHSPFPSLGLHVFGEFDRKAERKRNEAELESSSNQNTDIDDFIPSLNEKRKSLETLFNSAAASSSVTERRTGKADQQVSGDTSIAMTKSWMKKHAYKVASKTDSNPDYNQALKYANTVDDRWRFTTSELAEEVYADVWHEINELFDLGVAMEENGENVESGVVSTVFVTTNFASFNASIFKKFAVTVNAALKYLTGGKIFLEIFHPEYVGKEGNRDALRRAPFPTIQICYRIGRVD